MSEDEKQVPEGETGGGSPGRGPSRNVGGEQQPGGAVPPYDGRREKADVDQADSPEGADLEGATGPANTSGMSSAKPDDTPGGRTTSPADEQPASEMKEGGSPEATTGPAHVKGTPKGEGGGT